MPYFFLFIFIILLSYLLYKIHNLKNVNEGFVDKNAEVVKVSRPWVNLFDNNGNKLNIIMISKPVSGDEHYKTYLENKDKFIFIGITSYLEFPNMVSNPFENFTENYKKYKYKEICKAWLHGFRNPENYFPDNIPRLLLSESDFCDCNANKPNPTIEKEYDFIYICLKQNEKNKTCDDWATFNKNWSLAKKCLSIMCNKFKLKGALIGRKDCKIDISCKNLMHTTNSLSNEELRKYYNKSKFIFLPNEKDASPRVLTEAFNHNLPCLINKNILGGWKYINHQTGEFFENEKDIEQSLNKLLINMKNNQYTPRKYFLQNYGVINSGKKLKRFLYAHFKNDINIPEDQVEYITPEFSKKDFKECDVFTL